MSFAASLILSKASRDLANPNLVRLIWCLVSRSNGSSHREWKDR